jgi:hypothetical protein
MTQPDLFSSMGLPPVPHFDGATIDHERDTERLTKQLDSVRAWMISGHWRTLASLAELTGAPESSVSARLRDLRKPKFGCYKVERRYVKRGLFEYRVIK